MLRIRDENCAIDYIDCIGRYGVDPGALDMSRVALDMLHSHDGNGDLAMDDARPSTVASSDEGDEEMFSSEAEQIRQMDVPHGAYNARHLDDLTDDLSWIARGEPIRVDSQETLAGEYNEYSPVNGVVAGVAEINPDDPPGDRSGDSFNDDEFDDPEFRALVNNQDDNSPLNVLMVDVLDGRDEQAALDDRMAAETAASADDSLQLGWMPDTNAVDPLVHLVMEEEIRLLRRIQNGIVEEMEELETIAADLV